MGLVAHTAMEKPSIYIFVYELHIIDYQNKYDYVNHI